MYTGQLQQSEATAARRRVYFHLVDVTDGMTPETGEAGGQPEISTNGGAWGSTSATLTAIGNGRYYVELTSGELGTLGNVQLRFKSANTAEALASAQVVLFNPFAAITIPTAADNADAVWDEATAGHTTSGTFGEQAKTDVDAIKAKTDLIPSDPAETSDIPSAATIAAAVWAYVVEGSFTALGFIRLCAAALGGKLSGAATTTVTIRDPSDAKNRVVATVDSSGNRSSVTLDLT